MSLITKKEKFLIIGCNSFSGAHFVNGLLKRGYKVWGTSRSEQPKKEFLPYFWNDINDFTIKKNCENFLNKEILIKRASINQKKLANYLKKIKFS